MDDLCAFPVDGDAVRRGSVTGDFGVTVLRELPVDKGLVKTVRNARTDLFEKLVFPNRVPETVKEFVLIADN